VIHCDDDTATVFELDVGAEDVVQVEIRGKYVLA
jgi:hypothetical protein